MMVLAVSGIAANIWLAHRIYQRRNIVTGPFIVTAAIICALIAGWCIGTWEARKDNHGTD